MIRIKTLALATIAAVSFTGNASAQDNVEATVSADVVSKYIWRGQELGEGAAVQPTLGIAYKGLSLSAWGSQGLVNSNETEFDLTLAYTTGDLTIGITDYYCDPSAKYFSYGKNKTVHTFEANLGYDFGAFSVNWFTNFAGSDAKTSKGDRAYSSYVEIAAPFSFGGVEWEAAAGAVPFETAFYSKAEGFAVTNISLKASKDLKINDGFKVPVFGQIATNPSTQKAYFVVGFSIQP